MQLGGSSCAPFRIISGAADCRPFAGRTTAETVPVDRLKAPVGPCALWRVCDCVLGRALAVMLAGTRQHPASFLAKVVYTSS